VCLSSALVLNLEAPDDRFLELGVVEMVVLAVDGLELLGRSTDHDGLLDESVKLAVICSLAEARADVEGETHGRKLGCIRVYTEQGGCCPRRGPRVSFQFSGVPCSLERSFRAKARISTFSKKSNFAHFRGLLPKSRKTPGSGAPKSRKTGAKRRIKGKIRCSPKSRIFDLARSVMRNLRNPGKIETEIPRFVLCSVPQCTET
jgi:hypothetical protein